MSSGASESTNLILVDGFNPYAWHSDCKSNMHIYLVVLHVPSIRSQLVRFLFRIIPICFIQSIPDICLSYLENWIHLSTETNHLTFKWSTGKIFLSDHIVSDQEHILYIFCWMENYSNIVSLCRIRHVNA